VNIGDAPWRDLAICAGEATRDYDPWFPLADHDPRPGHGRTEAALAIGICRHCPVRRACLDEAMAVESAHPLERRHGIFGGMTPRQRARMDPNRRGSARCPVPDPLPVRESA